MENRRRWERVLNAVEADTRRAEALLLSVQGEAAADAEAPASRAVPAEWLLPTAEAAAHPETTPDLVRAYLASDQAQLPPLDEMPEVPYELRERILELRARIIELQDELAVAISELQPLPPAPPLQSRPKPQYVDRNL